MKTRIKKETRIVDGVEEVKYIAQAFHFPMYFWWEDAEVFMDAIGCWQERFKNERLWHVQYGSLEYAEREIKDLNNCWQRYQDNIRKDKQRKKVKKEYL